MLKTMGILKVSLLYYTVFYSLAYIPMTDIGGQISANINRQLMHSLPFNSTLKFGYRYFIL